MKYLTDPNLEFLRLCTQDDLKGLVDVMTKDKGELRWLETLTIDETYTKSKDDLPTIWETLAAYLQICGADTLMTTMRGHGVSYDEIVGDVAGKLDADLKGAKDIVEKEARILTKIFEKSFEKMTEEERVAFTKEFLDKGGNGSFDFSRATPAAMTAALQALILRGGFSSYQMAVIAANAVLKAATGKGLQLAANAALTRWIGILAGPIGWAVSALLTILMVSGPAYSVTIPAVVQVAYLRLKLANEPLL